MYTIEINIDDSIYDTIMGLLNILPEDKLEIISKKEHPNVSFEESRRLKYNISSIEVKIDKLLKKENLLHFKFYKNPHRVLNTHGSGSSTNVQDFNRLKTVLRKEGIKFNDIGVDVIMIEED